MLTQIYPNKLISLIDSDMFVLLVCTVPPLWFWGRSSPCSPRQCSSWTPAWPPPPRVPEDDEERSASPRCAPSAAEPSPHKGSTPTGFPQRVQPVGQGSVNTLSNLVYFLFVYLLLTMSSSCLAVVCSVTQNTVKGSGPGAPYTVTQCCCERRFSSELNNCVKRRIKIFQLYCLFHPSLTGIT